MKTALSIRFPIEAPMQLTFTFIKGEGEECFEPRFTYHGFRYVEMTGFPGTPALESLEGCVVHSAVPPSGRFLCSNALINQIHQNVLWGQLSNLMSIPTDCPQRDERLGWLGDAHLTVEEAIHNFEMAGFYTKWMRDIRDARRITGACRTSSPRIGTCILPIPPGALPVF
jgi:alpha-L-rhamnosidase